MIRLIPFLFMTGCVNAPVAPNLKIPNQAKECPRLFMPPVPQVVYLKIDGDKIEADDGGDMLLRGYVRSRYLLK